MTPEVHALTGWQEVYSLVAGMSLRDIGLVFFFAGLGHGARDAMLLGFGVALLCLAWGWI